MSRPRPCSPALPTEQQPAGEAFISMLKGVEPAEVDVTLHGGDVLDICGGCEVIDTPGHTPGHISLYLPAQGTVVTGDAMVLEQGSPAVANPQFAFDLAPLSLSGKACGSGRRTVYMLSWRRVYTRVKFVRLPDIFPDSHIINTNKIVLNACINASYCVKYKHTLSKTHYVTMSRSEVF